MFAVTEVEVAFGPDDEEGAGGRDAVQAGEIEVGPIHDVERLRFDGHGVEDVDIVHFPPGKRG